MLCKNCPEDIIKFNGEWYHTDLMVGRCEGKDTVAELRQHTNPQTETYDCCWHCRNGCGWSQEGHPTPCDKPSEHNDSNIRIEDQ